jgi:DNA-binding phage protein
MDKKTYDKIKSMTISHDDFMQEQLKDEEFQYAWLRQSIEDYIQTGDFTVFYRAIERVVKARTTISQLARDLNMNRGNLSEILNGKVEPKMQTACKILKILGYDITITKRTIA